MAKPQITQEQVDKLIAALEKFEPVRELDGADFLFDQIKPLIVQQLRKKCPPDQLIALIKSHEIPLGKERLSKFVRGLAPKRRRKRVRKATSNGSNGKAVTETKSPVNPPRVDPPAPPVIEPVVTTPTPPAPREPVTTGGRSGASSGRRNAAFNEDL